MKSLEITIAATLTLGSSVALAHGDGHTATSWQHFLTSPDHVALLVSATLAALGGGLYFWQTSKLQPIRLKKD